MPNKNELLNIIPDLDKKIELLGFALMLINHERERIKKKLAEIDQYLSKHDLALWRSELNACDYYYAEFQRWQTALVYARNV